MRIKYLPLPKGFKLTPNHEPLYTEAQMKAYVKVHIKQLIEKKESK